MNASNNLSIMGRLTRDPETRSINSSNGEFKMTDFTVAVQRPKTKNGDQKTDFFRCSASGTKGDTIAKYFKKGSKILVCGEVHLDEYTAKDGTKKNSTTVSVSDFAFIDSASGNGGNNNNSNQNSRQQERNNYPAVEEDSPW